MDETYPVEAYPHASQKFNFQSYFREYSKLLKETWYINQGVLERLNNDEEKIASQLGIEMKEYHRLEERCRSEIINFAPSQLILTIIFLIVSVALLQCDPLEMEIKAGQLAGQFVLINFLWKLWLTISVDPERRATRKLATAVELKALKACQHKYESKLRELKRTAIPQFVSLNLNIFNWNTSYFTLLVYRNKKWIHLLYSSY